MTLKCGPEKGSGVVICVIKFLVPGKMWKRTTIITQLPFKYMY